MVASDQAPHDPTLALETITQSLASTFISPAKPATNPKNTEWGKVTLLPEILPFVASQLDHEKPDDLAALLVIQRSSEEGWELVTPIIYRDMTVKNWWKLMRLPYDAKLDRIADTQSPFTVRSLARRRRAFTFTHTLVLHQLPPLLCQVLLNRESGNRIRFTNLQKLQLTCIALSPLIAGVDLVQMKKDLDPRDLAVYRKFNKRWYLPYPLVLVDLAQPDSICIDALGSDEYRDSTGTWTSLVPDVDSGIRPVGAVQSMASYLALYLSLQSAPRNVFVHNFHRSSRMAFFCSKPPHAYSIYYEPELLPVRGSLDLEHMHPEVSMLAQFNMSGREGRPRSLSDLPRFTFIPSPMGIPVNSWPMLDGYIELMMYSTYLYLQRFTFPGGLTFRDECVHHRGTNTNSDPDNVMISPSPQNGNEWICFRRITFKRFGKGELCDCCGRNARENKTWAIIPTDR